MTAAASVPVTGGTRAARPARSTASRPDGSGGRTTARLPAGPWPVGVAIGTLDSRPADVAVSVAAPPVGLYVHVPFCVSLCPYCDFVVYTGSATRGRAARIPAFLDALHAEIDLRADVADRAHGAVGGAGRPALDTLYLGGGTPSLLAPRELAALVDHVARRFGLAGSVEVSLEANPGPDERGDAHAQRSAGVTRISYGAQSMTVDELRRLGRRHTPTDVGLAVEAAREAGIESVNLDLLYDAPGQTLQSWMDGLEQALDLAPDHLSLYALSLDDPSAEGLTGPDGDHLPVRDGARRWRERARPEQDDDRAAAMYHHAVVRLDEAGYRGYEISNWARPGHESRHNRAYWERRAVEAVGPGAHAFDGRARRWNAARLDRYVAALAPPDGQPRLPPGAAEVLDGRTVVTEELILGLRTHHGVPIECSLEPPLADVFGWALAAGLVEVDDERIRLSVRGRLLSNELFSLLV